MNSASSECKTSYDARSVSMGILFGIWLDHPIHGKPAQTFKPEEYTQAKFRKAYEELHIFREFVRICDLRRKLGWPREAFDGMIRTLRDNRIIRVIRADESMLTQEEIRDCFVDENKTLMGLITWNGR